jgi:hypothetical protein
MDTNGATLSFACIGVHSRLFFGFPGPQVQNVGVNGIRWVAGLLVLVALLAIFIKRRR